MGCATTTVKIASIIFNVLLAILAIGAIVVAALDSKYLPSEGLIPAYIVFALIIVFALLGCYAAIRESVCLTVTCAVFLLLLAMLQIALTIVVLNDREMQSGINTVEDAWNFNKMDELQKEHECCGKDSPQDYILLNKQIPASCYPNNDVSATSHLFVDGCSVKLQKFYDVETTTIANASWVLIAFEIIGFLLAVFLVINFRNKQRRMQF